MMLTSLLSDDKGAFTLKEMIEGVLTLGVGIILMAIIMPIAFQIFGGLPANVAIDPITGNPTMTAIIWGYIPTIAVLMILVGLIYAIMGWLGGIRGRLDE